MGGIQRDRVLQVLLRERDLPSRQRGARLAQLPFGGVGDEFLEEGADGAFRLRADELRYGPAVGEGDDERNRARAELRGKLRALVGVDLDELPVPAGFALELLERRAQRLAGAAPRGPEVDEDGNFPRSLEDFAFERGKGGIDHGC